MVALRILGAIWCLPCTLAMWLCYLLPLWALGKVEFGGVARFGVLRFWVVQDLGWYHRAWAMWSGFAMPHAILLNSPAAWDTEDHELRHTDQWLLLGVLFPVVYLLALVTVGYRANPLERDARDWAERLR